jgi:hypothetical protein
VSINWYIVPGFYIEYWFLLMPRLPPHPHGPTTHAIHAHLHGCLNLLWGGYHIWEGIRHVAAIRPMALERTRHRVGRNGRHRNGAEHINPKKCPQRQRPILFGQPRRHWCSQSRPLPQRPPELGPTTHCGTSQHPPYSHCNRIHSHRPEPGR